MTRLEQVRVIHRAVTDDAYRTARRAVADEEWPDDPDLLCGLLDDYRQWLTGVIDQAVTEAQAYIRWSA